MADQLSDKQRQILASIQSDPKAFVIRLTDQLTSMQEQIAQQQRAIAKKDADIAKKDALIASLSKSAKQQRSESAVIITQAKQRAESITTEAQQKAKAIKASAEAQVEQAKVEAESIIASTLSKVNSKIKMLERQRNEERDATVEMLGRIADRYQITIDELNTMLSKCREKKSYIESYKDEIANETFSDFNLADYVHDESGAVQHVADRNQQTQQPDQQYQQQGDGFQPMPEPQQGQSFMAAFDQSGSTDQGGYDQQQDYVYDQQQGYGDGYGYDDGAFQQGYDQQYQQPYDQQQDYGYDQQYDNGCYDQSFDQQQGDFNGGFDDGFDQQQPQDAFAGLDNLNDDYVPQYQDDGGFGDDMQQQPAQPEPQQPQVNIPPRRHRRSARNAGGNVGWQ